jgi:LysR family transcriptional regulator, glycine cleavage system transcriptional activator
MRRHLPPLNTLKAFEAAARHESFTRAAEELHVTQGAISQRVKALETELGIQLFKRERQSLITTSAGREYLGVVRTALDHIAAGTERLLKHQHSGVLTVSTSPDFAAKWLVPRLSRFTEAHAEVDLRISATMPRVDFAREDVDVAVRHGDGAWDGLHVVRFCAEELFVVCSPRLITGRQRVRHPADVLKCPLLHLDSRRDWAKWLKAAGVIVNKELHGPIINRASMLIDAAVDGQGVALARTALASWDLLNGRLVRPFAQTLTLSNLYWIVCPNTTASIPKITMFRDWLLAEAVDDARRLRDTAR